MGTNPWQAASSLLKGELWISWAPTVTVREDVGRPSSCHLKLPGGSNGPHRGRGRTRKRRTKLNPQIVVLSSSHLPPGALPVISQPPASEDLSHPREGGFLRFPPPGVSCHPISGATRTCSKSFASLTEQTGAMGTSWYFNGAKILAQKFLYIFFLTCVWLFVIVSFLSSNYSLVKLRTLSELMTISVRTRNWPAMSQPPTSRILGLFKGRP